MKEARQFGALLNEKLKINNEKLLNEKIFNSYKAAFTLAEVLITLSIIGVVAALTMPTVINNYQKKETITRLKKTYTVLNQMLKLSEIQNGEISDWENADDIGRAAFVEKYYLPFLNGAKCCSGYEECGYKDELPWQSIGGGRKNSYSVQTQKANCFLSDGTFLRVGNGNGILVDLNGPKGPNIYGKDVFNFKAYNTSTFKPDCIQMTKEQVYERCSNQTGDGVCCSTRLINYDNWQIKDDYPW